MRNVLHRGWYLVAVLLFGAPLVVVAQWDAAQPEEIMRAILRNTEKYEAMNAYELEYDVLYYADQLAKSVTERTSARLTVKGQKYFADQLGVRTWQDDRLRISVDTLERVVLIATPSPFAQMFDPGVTAELLVQCKALGKRRSKNGTCFRIMLPSTIEYEVLEVCFDDQGWMRELAVFWRTSPHGGDLYSPSMIRPKLVTEFAVPKRIDRDLPESFFDTDAVVDTRGDTPVLASPWKNYELIDTRLR